MLLRENLCLCPHSLLKYLPFFHRRFHFSYWEVVLWTLDYIWYSYQKVALPFKERLFLFLYLLNSQLRHLNFYHWELISVSLDPCSNFSQIILVKLLHYFSHWIIPSPLLFSRDYACQWLDSRVRGYDSSQLQMSPSWTLYRSHFS